MEYGKFASAEELLKGYNELEKSFTQKCQQLAALERAASDTKLAQENSTDGTSAVAPPSAEEVQSTTVEADTVPQDNAHTDAGVIPDGAAPKSNAPTEQQLQQYLHDNPEIALRLLQQRPVEFAPAVMSGGGNVSVALPSRPKTIKEASVMAKALFGEN